MRFSLHGAYADPDKDWIPLPQDAQPRRQSGADYAFVYTNMMADIITKDMTVPDAVTATHDRTVKIFEQSGITQEPIAERQRAEQAACLLRSLSYSSHRKYERDGMTVTG